MNAPVAPPVENTADVKLAALEKFVLDYMKSDRKVDQLQNAARTLTDIMSGDMKDTEQQAVWLLLRYVKRKEVEAAALVPKLPVGSPS